MIGNRASKQGCDLCPEALLLSKDACGARCRADLRGARDMARDIAKTDCYQTSRFQRKKVEMLFAHVKRIVKLGFGYADLVVRAKNSTSQLWPRTSGNWRGFAPLGPRFCP
ncbi:hypothetical protein GHK68_09415 [Sinorhizobium meliloti]|uniref:hypothetical protein n=1 Tax=Rhizobium meliloti TaxID=382 RepID=UPI0013AA8A1C|nr:hypothetical protein [Sinorhizobium meliloti]